MPCFCASPISSYECLSYLFARLFTNRKNISISLILLNTISTRSYQSSCSSYDRNNPTAAEGHSSHHELNEAASAKSFFASLSIYSEEEARGANEKRCGWTCSRSKGTQIKWKRPTQW
mmetsp:Transcript_23643/g.37965  ORF Transcript_23643/g.37965 Transcript_23643/m.37965 type:complete len:118 (+) Transcript_23643:111-464(+)